MCINEGMKEVPCFVVHLSEEKERQANIALNKISGRFDEDKLKAVLKGLSPSVVKLAGFDPKDLMQMSIGPIIREDEAPEPPKTPISKLGDIWQLGEHRLMCGDSTDAEAVAKLMDGRKADIIFTDPPYNSASESKNYAADCSKAMGMLALAEWDKGFNIITVLKNILNAISDNASVYICTSHFLAGDIWAWMKTWADHYYYCIWSKPNPMPSLSKRHWTWNTELICYATRGKHIFNFPNEGHALSTWIINKRNGDTGHPTEKPVGVPANAIIHSSNEGCSVLDLFGGSGSTLIACEQLGRKCYMMELDPHYCDVIIQRWENLTGEKAVMLSEK